MKEVGIPGGGDAFRDSFRAALATILELSLSEVPEAGGAADAVAGGTLTRWLGGLGMGLVPVAEPRTFAWAGPWLACVQPPRGERRFVVMYGVPSGVVWDPAGDGAVASEWLVEGFVVAASDIALARPASPAPPRAGGVLEEIWVAAAAGEPVRALDRVTARAGAGLDGDRHVTGRGTFPSGLPGSALTLIEAEVCESFEPPLRAGEHRRNLVTRGIDLNALVGREFTIGSVRCRGMRLCEPCRVVDGYASRPVLRALVHRGGLRADVLEDGEVRTGDPVSALDDR
ncbi:MAG TPA: MOSC domain-containing protein [Gaiellaceae bacterium]|nr:MOSC domain-containing protein [Gaiellaceae bacterium]